MYGMKFSGNLSMLNKVKLTNAVLASRLLFSSIKMNVANETTATMNGAHDHIKLDNEFNKADFIKRINSFSLIFLTIF